MRKTVRLALLAAAIAGLSGCGSGGGAASLTKAVSSLASPEATLSPSAVPYLRSRFSRLTPAGLAREAGAPKLRRELQAWGFLAGADRYFQGESRELQVVDSRMLRFKTARGATRFVEFIRSHAAVYLGAFPGMRRLVSRGRSGILATAQECTCHLANPAYLAVVAHGGAVTWLEINGPGATSRRLAQLLAATP